MRRSQIAPGVHLSYDAAQKFNRCRISIHFAFPARRETATAHALLPLVMERGYADCPDMTQLTKKLARLYGADLTVDARPMGCQPQPLRQHHRHQRPVCAGRGRS